MLMREHELGQGEQPGLDQLRHREAERRLQPDDPVGRVVELPLLRVVVVRRVIGADDVDRAVAQSPAGSPPGPSGSRSGGFILALVLYPSHASWVSVK